MKTTEMLKQIQTLLNTRVELEDKKLDNGTVISADEFAEKQPVFIVTEDEKIPMPIGEYKMEDGSMLIVEEEGLIAEIKPAKEAEEEEEKEEAQVEEEMSNDVTEPKKVVESTVVETHFSEEQKSELVEVILSNVNPLIEELQNKVNELEAKLSQEPAEEVKEEVQENLSAEVKEEKLSKTFKHSPEVKGEKATPKFNHGRVANTTLQRVFQRISNNK